MDSNKSQRAQNKGRSNPPKSTPKVEPEPGQQPGRQTGSSVSPPAPTPAVDRRMDRLFEFLEEERLTAKGLARNGKRHRVRSWIWIASACGAAAVIAIAGFAFFGTQPVSPPPGPAVVAAVSEPNVARAEKPAGPTALKSPQSASLPSSKSESAPATVAASDPEVEPESQKRVALAKPVAGEPSPVQAPAETKKHSDSGDIERDDKQPDNTLPGPRTDAPVFFNGRDLAGWENPDGCWRVEKGVLIGSVSPEHKILAILRTQQRYRDFDLKFKVRVNEGGPNCAVEFREASPKEIEAAESGPACILQWRDKSKTYSIGSLARGLAKTPEILDGPRSPKRFVKAGDFNQVHIHCEGKTVLIRVNRIPTLRKTLSSLPDEGVIELKLDGRQQSGEVAFKD